MSTGTHCGLRRSPSLPPPSRLRAPRAAEPAPASPPRHGFGCHAPCPCRVPGAVGGRRRRLPRRSPTVPRTTGEGTVGSRLKKGASQMNPKPQRSPQHDRHPPHHAQGAPRPTRQVAPAASGIHEPLSEVLARQPDADLRATPRRHLRHGLPRLEQGRLPGAQGRARHRDLRADDLRQQARHDSRLRHRRRTPSRLPRRLRLRHRPGGPHPKQRDSHRRTGSHGDTRRHRRPPPPRGAESLPRRPQRRARVPGTRTAACSATPTAAASLAARARPRTSSSPRSLTKRRTCCCTSRPTAPAAPTSPRARPKPRPSRTCSARSSASPAPTPRSSTSSPTAARPTRWTLRSSESGLPRSGSPSKLMRFPSSLGRPLADRPWPNKGAPRRPPRARDRRHRLGKRNGNCGRCVCRLLGTPPYGAVCIDYRQRRLTVWSPDRIGW